MQDLLIRLAQQRLLSGWEEIHDVVRMDDIGRQIDHLAEGLVGLHDQAVRPKDYITCGRFLIQPLVAGAQNDIFLDHAAQRLILPIQIIIIAAQVGEQLLHIFLVQILSAVSIVQGSFSLA